MIKKIKKMLSVVVAASITAVMAAYMPTFAADVVKVEVGTTVEAENLTLNGTSLWTSIYDKEVPGYSGEGFVYMAGGSVDFEIDAEEDGMYEIWTSYVQILNKDEARQQSLEINGKKFICHALYTETWKPMKFGTFRLNKGTNTVSLTMEYGYAAYDTITVKKAEFPDVTTVSADLCDKNATPEAKGLMRYLKDMYGNHMLTGQQEIYGGGHTEDSPNGYSGADLLGFESEFEWIKKNFGVYPAIRGFDLMNFNPLYGWDDGSVERIIEWGQKGGIPTICWHINLPKDFENYTLGEELDWESCSYEPKKITGFSVANATVEGTKEYEYVQLATKCLAEELLKVQDENIPVIFRPYHEAQGNYDVYEMGTGAWFWWGQDGPEPYKALWKQLYTDLTEKYGLHNLIWEYNSYDYATSAPWYPGDEYVDIVGYDKYSVKGDEPNEDAFSSTFYTLAELTDNKKMVSMPENDTVPSLENIMVEKAYWLYFCIWYDNGSENFLSGTKYNNPETLKELYQSDFCITLDELPQGSWADYKSGDVKPTDPTEKPTTPDYGFIPGDVTDDKKVNVFDSIALKRYLINFVYGEQPAVVKPLMASPMDVTGDGKVTIADLTLLNQFLVGKDVHFEVYKEPVPTPD